MRLWPVTRSVGDMERDGPILLLKLVSRGRPAKPLILAGFSRITSTELFMTSIS